MPTVEIDGSYGEGGGQILRTALSLSVITGTPFRMVKIRAGRRQPGLRPQHLTSVHAAAAISRAEMDFDKVGSLSLEFAPLEIEAGDHTFAVGTAGAVTLVLQTLLPPLRLAGREGNLTLTGGTHVPFSPPFHFISDVFLPTVRRMGVYASAELRKAGWYPKGGGEVYARVGPPLERTGPDTSRPSAGTTPLTLTERGALQRVTVIVPISNLKSDIATRERNRAVNLLRDLGIKAETDIRQLPSIGQGTGVFILAEYENAVVGFNSLGAIGKPSEQVAAEAVDEFREFHQSNAAVAPHLTDQLLLYMALAKGTSLITTNVLTQHALTNIWVIEKFLPVRFQVDGQLGQGATITVSP